MRIGIIGSGALGLYYGALLQRAGHDVRFLLRRDYVAIMAHGLTVYSTHADFHLPTVRGFHDPATMGTVDLVVIGLKSFDNPRYRELISPLLGAETMILTLQNGLGNEESLAALFGPERVLGGVAFLCANRGKPGSVYHLGEGRILLGEFQRRDMVRPLLLAETFTVAGIECHTVEDLRRARWDKLIWNIPFNGVSALTLQPVDRLLADSRSRALIMSLMTEVIAGANGQGLSTAISPQRAVEMVAFSLQMGAYKPSMLIDREQGRPLELESIFRIPLRLSEAKGVAMVRVETLTVLLERVLSGTE